MGRAVGIDLGTTNSAVAVVDSRGRPVVLANAIGSPVTPSVICFRNGEIVVGQDAKDLQAAGERYVAAFFKRQMAQNHFAFFSGDRDYSAAELSGLLLSQMKKEAEEVLGEAITDAVITVPAYFRNPEREATIEAGRLAGLNVLQTLNEPTAAAMAYGVNDQAAERLLLVYDLGGGTFDVTLLSAGPAGIIVKTSEGDKELGGKDWDDRIVDFIGTSFRAETGQDPFADAESLADLLVRAEEAKKRLSQVNQVAVSVIHAGRRGRYELTAEIFERITSDLTERTLSLSRKVLADHGLSPSDLGGVLLVGGSTRMPAVPRRLLSEFGVAPLRGVNVDEAVALGAAIVAYGHTERAGIGGPGRTSGGRFKPTIDVTNHSLGMIAANEKRTKYLNSIILQKGLQLPCTQSRPFQYPVRGQPRDLEVYMTQGESDAPDSVTYLGKYVLHQVPPTDKKTQVVEISYSYDLSGTVQVTARTTASAQPLEVSVEPLPADVPARFLGSPQDAQELSHSTVYLVFDVSGSMAGSPLAEAQRAARGFLSQMDLAHCSVGLVALSDSVSVVVDACQNARVLNDGILSFRVGMTGGGNSAEPFAELQGRLKGVEGRRFVVVLTDGVWSDQSRAIMNAKECHKQGVEVIAIGFGGADQGFLKAIASSDEAGMFTSLGQLVQTFDRIAQVITSGGGGLHLR